VCPNSRRDFRDGFFLHRKETGACCSSSSPSTLANFGLRALRRLHLTWLNVSPQRPDRKHRRVLLEPVRRNRIRDDPDFRGAPQVPERYGATPSASVAVSWPHTRGSISECSSARQQSAPRIPDIGAMLAELSVPLAERGTGRSDRISSVTRNENRCRRVSFVVAL